MPQLPHALSGINPQCVYYTGFQSPSANDTPVAHNGDWLDKAPFIVCFFIPFSLPHCPPSVSWVYLINKLFAIKSLTQGVPLGPKPMQQGN